ncbi:MULTISPECIES: GMC family oxidoreductase [unclassified Bradyrhizobium]|uniref:GMC family oxidoreductase n=1 Tax=unclassified Bradyrhizobium TaxID=2631580 RepID=UPI001FF88F53|nr:MULTISPECIES: GMC family oxidoreductase [unclassified Bradyrhizobium]MCK1272145.1 GMC family oxidoreductase [Bradyrhizobium sp. 84]MCK1373800.1 GMC family oxidoreductase [Bradyrhizobium sp. 49]MCK1695027.1 GMC family oxidoreductase [Bradyrhizobium sp. 144]MCK1702795.1 GMC family oxidoreductase [Bradyrhizobium sp. 146]
MATKLKPVDAVIVGFGWTGAVLARELTKAGLNVLALERGGMRDTIPNFAAPMIHDELRFAIRHDLMQDASRETLTFRNNVDQTALPIRRWGSFLPGTGVGGAGVHWNGQHYRFAPSEFRIRSHYGERYGKTFIPKEMTIQDWPVTYEELEPYYDRFEYLCGTAGKAGNIKGVIQEGGNPFEGSRAREYPNPAMKRSFQMKMFEDATREMGFHPYVQPSSDVTQAYTNPEGVDMGSCVYCGFCERFGCEMSAKASPQSTLLPLLLKDSRFELRTLSHVTKVNLDSGRKKSTGVTYIDSQGREFEQPADMVLLCAFGLHNARLMMLSGIGRIYDPKTGKGSVGRNYAYQMSSSVTAHFNDKVFNPFMGAGACAMIIDDFNYDNFDHGPLGFVGGSYICVESKGQRPIDFRNLPPGEPRWGKGWKQSVAHWYNRTFVIASFGSVTAQRSNYLDLDPNYKDGFGNPLLRMTFDFSKNDLDMSKYCTDRAADIAKHMNPDKMGTNYRKGPYSIVPYQTTHTTGGTIMGADPTTSAVNRYLQSWDVPNVFVMGAGAFPQNPSHNPTGTVGALAYWAADAITTKYVKSPGRLVPS